MATIILVYLNTTSPKNLIIDILLGISVITYVIVAKARITGNSFLVFANFLKIVTIINKTTEM